MNKNEKIIMGILVGGIVIFLALSIILFLGKGKENVVENIPTSTTTEESSKKANISPYPTVPPIQNSTVMMNSRRFNPASVTIPRGGYIQFINIDSDPMTIESNDSNSSVLNLGAIAPGEYKQVTFNTPGTFTYKNKEKPGMTGIVIIQ
jgi:plastocyanin